MPVAYSLRGDRLESHNVDLLRLLLIYIIASKMKRETRISCYTMSIASEELTIKLNRLKFDTKDIAIATLLVSFLT